MQIPLRLLFTLYHSRDLAGVGVPPPANLILGRGGYAVVGVGVMMRLDVWGRRVIGKILRGLWGRVGGGGGWGIFGAVEWGIRGLLGWGFSFSLVGRWRFVSRGFATGGDGWGFCDFLSCS